MKRVLILFVALVLMLSGCTHKGDKVTIQFASWGSKTEVEIIKSVISEFEQENPNIKVEFLHIPQNYFQKIHLLFASNTEPDVIFLNNLYLPIYAKAGKLEKINPPKDTYSPKILQTLSWENDLYAIPRDISLLVIYYNKDLFKRANIAPPNSDWTLEDMLQIALKIKENTGAFGISFEEETLFYLPYLMSNGGTIFDLENPDTKETLKFYADLRKKYHVAPRKDESASATMAQLFLQGKIGMHLSGRWLTPKYRNDANFAWDTITFPNGHKGSIVPLDASGWAISKSSKHKNEAQKFIDYLSSQKTISKFAQTGLIIPARQDIEVWQSEAYKKALKTAHPTPVTVDYNKILDKTKIELENLFN